jgi:hypothetical protein
MPFDPEASLRVSSGGRKLIAAGSFLTLGADETKCDLQYAGEEISIVLEFIDAPESKETRYEAKIEGPTTVRLRFVNFSSPIGTFLTDPVELGTIGDHPLAIRWHVQGLQNSKAKLFTYSFYVGPKGPAGAAS